MIFEKRGQGFILELEKGGKDFLFLKEVLLCADQILDLVNCLLHLPCDFVFGMMQNLTKKAKERKK